MTSASHLSRVLNLVPYLLSRPGIRIDEAAADLKISVTDLRNDLTLLWMCGLPGYGPGDLIDIAFDDDTVTVTYDAGITRPVRLSPDEALALVVALRMLVDMPGLSDKDTVRRTLEKVAEAAGDAALAAAHVSVSATVDEQNVAVFRKVVADSQAVRLTYYSPGRDETTERVVDPIRVMIADDHAYLLAWCRRADDVRRFRLDRIDAYQVLDEPAEVPSHARLLRDGPKSAFTEPNEFPTITLKVNRHTRWVSEYYPCDSIEPQTDGSWHITMRVQSLAWARRLILGLGTDVVLIRPTELRQQIADEAAAALNAYMTDVCPTG